MELTPPSAMSCMMLSSEQNQIFLPITSFFVLKSIQTFLTVILYSYILILIAKPCVSSSSPPRFNNYELKSLTIKPERKDRTKKPVEETDLLVNPLLPGEECTKETAAPMPKTPWLPFIYNDLQVGLSVFLETKIRGNTPDDSGWQQNQLNALGLGGTAT